MKVDINESIDNLKDRKQTADRYIAELSKFQLKDFRKRKRYLKYWEGFSDGVEGAIKELQILSLRKD